MRQKGKIIHFYLSMCVSPKMQTEKCNSWWYLLNFQWSYWGRIFAVNNEIATKWISLITRLLLWNHIVSKTFWISALFPIFRSIMHACYSIPIPRRFLRPFSLFSLLIIITPIFPSFVNLQNYNENSALHLN